MEIPTNVQKLLNEQFYNELYAAHLYFAISAAFKRSPYQGFSSWMKSQYKEELEHAEKFYEYLTSRDAPFTPDAIKKPDISGLKTPLDLYKAALEHEKLVTKQITKIYDVANDEKDWVSVDFLTWFLKEQAEEEHTAASFVRALEYAGDDKNLIFGVNHWAAKRGE